MMEPDTREKYLKELAKTSFGIALTDWLDIEMKRLENIRLVPNDNFEIEARARKYAAEVLRKLFKFLNVANETEKQREKNPYE